MYFLAGLVGLTIGVLAWYVSSRWVVSSIFWIEHRFPETVGSKGIKAGEVALCGLQVFACLALAFWVARMLIG